MKPCARCDKQIYFGDDQLKNGGLCFRCDMHINGPVFHVFYFNEDRTRFFRGANGTRFSYALGQNMPETRAEFNKICEAKGIEPVSRREMPQSWKDAAQYAKHVREGGDRVDPASVVPKEPVEGVTSIVDMVRANPQKFRTA